MVIAVDFDGTCVENAWPDVGKDIGAAPVLWSLVAQGHKLILHTMRENIQFHHTLNGVKYPPRNLLHEALLWFEDNKIHLWDVNHHPEAPYHQRKVYADLYIDDHGLGIPLRKDSRGVPCVDWDKAAKLLFDMGVLFNSRFDYQEARKCDYSI